MPSRNLSETLRISTHSSGVFLLSSIQGHDKIYLAGITIDQIVQFKNEQQGLTRRRRKPSHDASATR